MFKFPHNLYTDVRIEDVSQTIIRFKNSELADMKIRKHKGSFIRIFDGNMWYYSCVSDIDLVQEEIDSLAQMATPDAQINEHPVVKNFQVNKGNFFKFKDSDISLIPDDDKLNLIQSYFPVIQKEELIKSWSCIYEDKHIIKKFYSSKGADLSFDTQMCELTIINSFAQNGKNFMGYLVNSSDTFSDLKNFHAQLQTEIEKDKDFMLNSQPVKHGNYTLILAPAAAGIFIHECFGHNSEADGMLIDENLKNEWETGKRIAFESLSVIDDGGFTGSAYTPFDDEGTKGGKTYIMKNGKLAGRLHNAKTAALFEEGLTGNARACDMENEPIIRMTTTFIDKGEYTKEKLFAGVKKGILVEQIRDGGAGCNSFSITPSRAYFIKDGQIDYPVNISVISGNIFETLGNIDGLSDEVTIYHNGCGKKGQGIRVANGGPYVRINNMNVQ